MANLLDYMAWRDDLTLERDALNEIDGVILARVAYFPFDAIGMSGKTRISLGAAMAAFLLVPDIKSKVLFREDYNLIKRLGDSPRFRGMELFGYENIFEAEKETQFSAVTVALGDGRHYVSFRGTDNTLVGWKENFNMSFESPVPAQLLAVKYLEKIAGSVKGRLVLGGHSKGGNLAVYAGAFCGGAIQDRLDAVYNFDGPGFVQKVLDEPGYDRICGRVRTLVPQSSVVGMLLEHEEEYAIVYSTQSGLLQHDVYSWETEQTHFVRLETVTDGSYFVDAALTDWIASLDNTQREAFVDAVYTILSETNATTLREMGEHWFSSAMAILRSLRELDEPTRETVKATLQALLRSAGEELLRPTRDRYALCKKRPPRS